MPRGSLTADHEIVNGTVTCAPFAGAREDGADGPAAAARPAVARARTRMESSEPAERILMRHLWCARLPRTTGKATWEPRGVRRSSAATAAVEEPVQPNIRWHP